jgi:hypothetical protein
LIAAAAVVVAAVVAGVVSSLQKRLEIQPGRRTTVRMGWMGWEAHRRLCLRLRRQRQFLEYWDGSG